MSALAKPVVPKTYKDQRHQYEYMDRYLYFLDRPDNQMTNDWVTQTGLASESHLYYYNVRTMVPST